LDPLDEGTDEVGTGLAVPTEVVLLATAEETDVDGKAVQVVAAAVEVLVTGPEEPGRRAERGWLEKMESARDRRRCRASRSSTSCRRRRGAGLSLERGCSHTRDSEEKSGRMVVLA
jgi:hypothetical protein